MAQFPSQQPTAAAYMASPAGHVFDMNNPGFEQRWPVRPPIPRTPSPAPYQNPDAINMFNAPYGSPAGIRAIADMAIAREQAAAQRYAAEQQANANKQGAYQGGLGSIGDNFSDNYGTFQRGIDNQTSTIGGMYNAGIGATGNLGRDIASNYNTYQSAANGQYQAQQQNAAERQRAISSGYGQNAQSNAMNLRAYTEAGNAVTDANARLQVGQLGALSGVANADSAAYVGNAQGNAGLANAYASAANGNQAALANLANAQANAAGTLANANATENAARSVASGNMTSAALGAYGGMGNSALSAVSQNAASYFSALAALGAATQGALANNSVGQANAYASQGAANQAALAAQSIAGSKLALSQQVLGSLAGGSMGSGGGGGSTSNGVYGFPDAGGSFMANGPNGRIASGSYGGSAIPAPTGLGRLFGPTTPLAAQPPSGLEGAHAGVMGSIGSASGAGDIKGIYGDGKTDMLNAFTSGQKLPQEMLTAAIPTFQSFLSQGLGSLGSGGGGGGGGGADFGAVMKDLKSGYSTAMDKIGGSSSTGSYDKYLGNSGGLASSILKDDAFKPQVLNPLLTSAYEANRAQNNSAYAAQDATSQGVYTGAQGVLSQLLAQDRSAMDSANAGINGLFANIGSLINQGQTAIIGSGAPDEVTQYTRSRDGYNNANQNVRDVMTNMGNAYYSQPVLTSGRQEFQYNNYNPTQAPVVPRRNGRI